MPDVGNASVTFLGLTSQLMESFDQVDARQKQSSTTAAASAIELKAAQGELRSAMSAVTAEGGASATNMEALAEAEKRVAIAAAEAKEAQLALKEALGLGIEKQSFFAEATSEVTGKLAAMLGVIAIAEGVTSFVEHVQQGVLQLQNLSEKTGINITTLAGLQEMSEKTGVSFEKVGLGIVKMEAAQGKAIKSSGAQRDAFQSLGIELTDLKHMNGEELFFKVAEAIAHQTNSTIAVSAAQAIFSKGGHEMIPMLKDYAGHIRASAEEEGRHTGVTAEAGLASKDWERVVVSFSTIMKATMIPVMQAAVPVMKSIVTGGSLMKLVFLDFAEIVNAVVLSSIRSLIGVAQVAGDVFAGHWKNAVVDGEKAVHQIDTIISEGFKGIGEHSKTFEDTYVQIWADHIPAAMKNTTDGMDKLEKADKKATEHAVAEAKRRMESTVAEIQTEREQVKLALEQKKISITKASEEELALTQKERKAKEDYFAELITLYKKAGEASKVRQTEDERIADRQKAATEATKGQIAAEKSLEEQTRKYGATAESVLGKTKEKSREAMTQLELMNKDWKTFIPQWSKDAAELERVLRSVGVNGLNTLRQNLDAAEKAEKKFTDSGIKSRQIFLELDVKRLKASIAVTQAEGNSAKQEIRQLHALEAELRGFDRVQKTVAQTAKETWEQNQNAIDAFKTDALSAFQALAQGGESFAQAMEQSTGKLISALAQHWAKYFFGMALADAVTPGKQAQAAGEFAAAAALEVLAGVAGSLGSSSGSSGSGSSKASAPLAVTSAAAQSAANPSGAPNVPHMAGGGLVTMPTLLMAGDARSAGSSSNTEAIIPLHNREAMEQIAEAISMRMGSHGGVNMHIGGIISADNLNRIVKDISRQVGQRRTRLTAGTSYRVTRRG